MIVRSMIFNENTIIFQLFVVDFPELLLKFWENPPPHAITSTKNHQYLEREVWVPICREEIGFVIDVRIGSGSNDWQGFDRNQSLRIIDQS